MEQNTSARPIQMHWLDVGEQNNNNNNKKHERSKQYHFIHINYKHAPGQFIELDNMVFHCFKWLNFHRVVAAAVAESKNTMDQFICDNWASKLLVVRSF